MTPSPGVVLVTPAVVAMPLDRMVDPARAEFNAIWYEDFEDWSGRTERVRVVGAEAAIAWAKERADRVVIRLDDGGDPEAKTSFSAGPEPAWIGGIHDGPLPSWPGALVPPPEGWYEPSEFEHDTFVRLAKSIEQLRASGELFFQPPQPDPNDPRFRPQPPPSDRLQATFKWEDAAGDGEDIGPLIVFDPDTKDVVWESPDWVRVSEARALAKNKGWQFGIDGSRLKAGNTPPASVW